MATRVILSESTIQPGSDALRINADLIDDWLVAFLHDECVRRRKITKAVIGLSGGVDSAVVAFLCAKAFGPENVHAIRMPYKTSSSESLSHAQLVVDQLGIRVETFDITAMVDGFAILDESMTPHRIGNLCARARTAILFDQSMRFGALPIGTGNKSERLLGYFTWHADDAPPINPLGDLFKTQVWELAKHVRVPEVIVNKPASADLIKGQTDEGDFGITYKKADPILHFLISGFTPQTLVAHGFAAEDVEIVRKRLDGTHWKRKLPTVAVLSNTAIGEWYLRPVDY